MGFWNFETDEQRKDRLEIRQAVLADKEHYLKQIINQTGSPYYIRDFLSCREQLVTVNKKLSQLKQK